MINSNVFITFRREHLLTVRAWENPHFHPREIKSVFTFQWFHISIIPNIHLSQTSSQCTCWYYDDPWIKNFNNKNGSIPRKWDPSVKVPEPILHPWIHTHSDIVMTTQEGGILRGNTSLSLRRRQMWLKLRAFIANYYINNSWLRCTTELSVGCNDRGEIASWSSHSLQVKALIEFDLWSLTMWVGPYREDWLPAVRI